MRDAYGLAPGEWMLVRPDGYVGAIIASEEVNALDSYLAGVGLAVEGELRDHTPDSRAEVRTA